MNPKQSEELRLLVERMPHNGARMFSTNKNELGHNESCYKCKLEFLLAAEGAATPAPGQDAVRLRVEQARAALVERITGWLSSGGLFNPEMTNADCLRDLLIDCRAALAAPPAGERKP